jgi:hypothetical protein
MNQQIDNVYEAWPLYDTVLIGDGQSDTPGWYESFAALGAADEVPFFNQRNRSGTHPAYNNFDSQEHLSFVYHCYSIGISFFGMPFSDFGDWNIGGFREMVPYTENYAKFCSELVQHSGFSLKVSQDEKLAICCSAAPSGAGISGFTRPLYVPGVDDVALGTFQNLSNGVPHITNRWKFKTPIEMPRAVNVSATLKFSELARDLLQAMSGPGFFYNSPVEQAEAIPCVAGIQLSMFGKREVQQRGQLHFTA